jgi:hypothetical protein
MLWSAKAVDGLLNAVRQGRVMFSTFDELPGFLELGAWTSRHIRPLFDLFRDEDVAPALALIILGTALVLCIFFLLDSTFIRIQVWRRIQAVRNIKGKVEFTDQMHQVEELSRVHRKPCKTESHGFQNVPSNGSPRCYVSLLLLASSDDFLKANYGSRKRRGPATGRRA